MRSFPLHSTRRGLFAAAALFLVAACGPEETNLDELAVVTIPTDTLTAAELRDILVLAPAMPNDDAALGAVSIWSDLALVSGAVANGANLADDATVNVIMRPVMMETTVQRFGATRAGSAVPTAAQIDSVARGTQVHVYRTFAIGPVDPSDSARVLTEGQRLVRLKQQAAVDGSTAAAMRSLGDEVSGIVVSEPVANARPELPQQLSAAIWRLNDGEISEPIIGNGGIQIFERVPNATAREAVAAWFTPVLQRRIDTEFIDSVMTSRGLTVVNDGASRLRAAGAEPGVFASDDALVTWSGGELRPGEALAWMALMPAPERARLRLGSDTSLTQMLNQMGRREILFELAVTAGIDTNAVRDELLPVFRERLTLLMSEAQATGDPTVWIQDVIGGRRQFQPLPGALSRFLRDRTTLVADDEARTVATREAARTWTSPGGAATP
jgi:hypothetical protein